MDAANLLDVGVIRELLIIALRLNLASFHDDNVIC